MSPSQEQAYLLSTLSFLPEDSPYSSTAPQASLGPQQPLIAGVTPSKTSQCFPVPAAPSPLAYGAPRTHLFSSGSLPHKSLNMPECLLPRDHTNPGPNYNHPAPSGSQPYLALPHAGSFFLEQLEGPTLPCFNPSCAFHHIQD